MLQVQQCQEAGETGLCAVHSGEPHREFLHRYIHVLCTASSCSLDESLEHLFFEHPITAPCVPIMSASSVCSELGSLNDVSTTSIEHPVLLGDPHLANSA